jgi:basic membrane protein A
MAYSGLAAVKDAYGAEVAYTENTPASDYEEIFQGYAVAGYDVVVGHGFQFGDAAKAVAKRFPKTKFIVTSTDIYQAPNLASLNTNYPQAGFIQGAIAALLSKSGKVGFVGGMEIPSITDQEKGFIAGARYVKPSIQATGAYTGSWDDISKAKEMARAMLENGADVIVPDANEAGLGVAEVVREKHAYLIGTTTDMGENFPDITITSMMFNFPTSFKVCIGYVMNGTFKPMGYNMGLKEGSTHLAPYRAQKARITGDVKKKIDDVIAKVTSGKIDAIMLAKQIPH